MAIFKWFKANMPYMATLFHKWLHDTNICAAGHWGFYVGFLFSLTDHWGWELSTEESLMLLREKVNWRHLETVHMTRHSKHQWHNFQHLSQSTLLPEYLLNLDYCSHCNQEPNSFYQITLKRYTAAPQKLYQVKMY